MAVCLYPHPLSTGVRSSGSIRLGTGHPQEAILGASEITQEPLSGNANHAADQAKDGVENWLE